MRVAFTIFGEAASKANTRKLATIGKGPKKRIAFIKSDKARTFERDALRQIPNTARLQITGPVKVTIRLFYATERPDLDESVLLDVMQDRYEKDKYSGKRELIWRGVYVNDRQVREKHVYHGIDKGNPRAEVVVETMDEPQAELLGKAA